MVFPSRRASLFFNRCLSQVISKPIWAPQSLTIGELMQKFTPLIPTDSFELLINLYDIYNKEKNTTESFSDFYFWGEMMLGDFDDVDKYLVDANKLFTNIKDIKEIDQLFDFLEKEQIEAIRMFWIHFDPSKSSIHKQNFISIWKVLSTIYSQLNSKLREKNIGYDGMIYRDAVKNIQNTEHLPEGIEHFAFAGFNALNRCEEYLFNHLNKLKKASFYWDYDELYVGEGSSYHQAGYFMRKNLIHFPPTIKLESFFKAKKNIEIISVSSNTGQANLTGHLIDFIKDELSDNPDTAIILGDENLLMPVLYSMPDMQHKVNITMGYPMRNTSVWSLIEVLTALKKNARQEANGTTTYYHKNIEQLAEHPFFQCIAPDHFNTICKNIIKENHIRVNTNFLLGHPLADRVFEISETNKIVTTWFSKILEYLLNKMEALEDTKLQMDIECLFRMYTTVNRIHDCLTERNIIPSTEIFMRILRDTTAGRSIPFAGEPLIGIQVMGLLETRALDFKRIIMLSVNEGKIPKTSPAPSFIPYNLRLGNGLPTIEHQDAIFAYYFYRILQRAENIKLLYTTSGDGISKGEQSRFIMQLKYDSSLLLIEKSINSGISIPIRKEIIISKNTEIQKILERYREHSALSPSALTSYLDCRLKFFFSYIAHIKEAETVSEEIEARYFGDILHKSIYHIYKEYIGEIIDPKQLLKIAENTNKIEDIIYNAINEELGRNGHSGIEMTGSNILLKEVLKKYLKKIILRDCEQKNLKIIDLENEYRVQLPIGNSTVLLRGTIDRIDQIGEVVRIVDYKTGNITPKIKSISELFSRDPELMNKAAFQLLYYSLLYNRSTSFNGAIMPAVYTIRSIYNADFKYSFEINGNELYDYRIHKKEFEEQLELVFTEIFDVNFNFDQTEHEATCTYCPYSQICHK